MIVFSEKGVSFSLLFTSYAYIVRDNAKTFTSVGLSCKDVILFLKNYMFNVVYVKQRYMLIFWSESHGNNVEKANGSRPM